MTTLKHALLTNKTHSDADVRPGTGNQTGAVDPRSAGPVLTRRVFKTSRKLEYFTQDELTQQVGMEPIGWPLVLTKELTDNALDAAEREGITPQIQVTLDSDSITVQDNGPGLSESTLHDSLDYLVRVSDKLHYISPSRGQLGNALKCVWAAPLVADGEHGRVQIGTQGKLHDIDIRLDRIAQEPQIHHSATIADVKTGTSVKIYWPDLAGCLAEFKERGFYIVESIAELLSAFSAFNPHAGFEFLDRTGDGGKTIWPSRAPDWNKWTPRMPTSPHWYRPEQLQNLIAALLGREREGFPVPTVREFVSEFAGLSGTAKQKAVAVAAGLTGASLHDLVSDGHLDRNSILRLLKAMQAHSRPIQAKSMGVLGEALLSQHLVSQVGISPESIRYKRQLGETEGLPFVLEMALAIRTEAHHDQGRSITVGLNWTPVFKVPLDRLTYLLGQSRVDQHDPVAVMVHLACPHLEFTERGKGSLQLPDAINEALERGVGGIAKHWKRAKRRADQQDRVRDRELRELRRWQSRQECDIKEAAFICNNSGIQCHPGQRL